jgi:flagellar biogenesis protein FliO
MLRTIFYFLALFFLLRFVLRFVLPLMRLTSETHKRMRQMREEMDTGRSAGPTEVKKSAPEEDYIEYEEVK